MFDMKTGIDFIKKYKSALIGLSAVIAAFIYFIGPSFLNLVEFLGFRIPQNDLRSDYIKGVLWAIFLGLTITVWPVNRRDKKALLVVWVIKCILMLIVMLFFEYHYQLDMFGYFAGAKHDPKEWAAMEMVGPSLSVASIIWLHLQTFLNSFHATKATFGMIGLVGIYMFYRAVVLLLRQEKIKLFYFFALFPTILFWSSAIGKEPLMLFSLSLFFYALIRYARDGYPWFGAVLLLSLATAAYIRPWLGLIFGMPTAVICLLTLRARRLKINIVFFIVLAFIILHFSAHFMRGFGINSSNGLIEAANAKFVNFNMGGSVLAENNIPTVPEQNGMINKIVMPEPPPPARPKYNSLTDVLFFIPKGLFSALFRPLPADVHNIFALFAGLEDAFMLILFVLAVKRARLWKLKNPICIWAALSVMLWAVLYGFVSFNMGSICRYRMQILPVFLGLLLYLMYVKKGEIIFKKEGR